MTRLASEVVIKPVISEKSMDETQRGKYTFRVHSDANKLEIKRAVEELFHQGQGEDPQSAARPDDRLDVALEEGSGHGGGRPEDRILRGGLVECRCAVTSPPHPADAS
jgi:hypothetical protein